MMQSLRDNMKIIIWATAIIFLVGFGVLELGGVFGDAQPNGGRGVIAKINGEPIRYDEFMQLYNQLVAQVTRERPLQEGEDSYVREQAWGQLVRTKLMEQEARRQGIVATPDEIKTSIRLAPPEFLIQAPVFLTDGQFDYRKYLAELENPNTQMPWQQVEAYVAASLPVQKLQDQVASSVKISEGDVRDRFRLVSEKVDIRYVVFRPDSFFVDTTRIGGADIETYYKAHPEEFTGPAQSKVQVLLVPRVPSDSDFAARRERLQMIVDQIRAEPDSFESFARTYSEIGSAAGGGDVPGAPYADEMRPTFRNGLNGVKEGELSPILREERSLHVFRVDRRYPDKDTGRERLKYHEIAVRVQPGSEAITAARAEVAACAKEAKRSGVAAVATKKGYRTFESNFFSQGASGNEIFQRFPEVEVWCFQGRIGDISKPIPTEAGWYLYQIKEKRKAGVRPLESVESEVKLALIQSLKTAKAEEAANQARAAVQAGMKDEDAASRFRGKTGTGKGVTRNGYIADMGREPRAAGTLFTVPPGAISPVLTTKSGVFFAHVDSHETPTEEEFEQQAMTIRQNLLNERRNVALNEWMQDMRRRAKIDDFRENFFEA
jgi:hypothetical protein